MNAGQVEQGKEVGRKSKQSGCMTMKKKMYWFTLSGCALVAAAVLWWWQASVIFPEYFSPTATTPDAMELTQTTKETSASPLSGHQIPASPETKPVLSSSTPNAQNFGESGKLKDAINPPLIAADEEAVKDTGEFLDPDAEIPSQSLNDEAEPMDTGPFINADSLSN
jgi:hypothetical protein